MLAVLAASVVGQDDLARILMDSQPAGPGYGVVAPTPTTVVGTIGAAVEVTNATVGGWYQYDPIVFSAVASPAVVCLGKLYASTPAPRLCTAGPVTSLWHCPSPVNSSLCFSHDAPGQLLPWKTSHSVAWHGTTAVVRDHPDSFEERRQMAFCVALLAIIASLRAFSGTYRPHEQYAKNWAVALISATVVAAPVSAAPMWVHLVLVVGAAAAAGAALASATEEKGDAQPTPRPPNCYVLLTPRQQAVAHLDLSMTAQELLRQFDVPASAVLYRGGVQLHPGELVVPKEGVSLQTEDPAVDKWAMQSSAEELKVTVGPKTFQLPYAATAGDLMDAVGATCNFTRGGAVLGRPTPLLGPLRVVRRLSHRDVSVIVAHAVVALSLPSAIGLAPILISRFLLGLGIVVDCGFQTQRAISMAPSRVYDKVGIYHMNALYSYPGADTSSNRLLGRRSPNTPPRAAQIFALACVALWATVALIGAGIEAAAVAAAGSPLEKLLITLVGASGFVSGSLSWHI